MRAPVGVAIVPGFVIVVCSDGAVFTAGAGAVKWTEDEPIPGTAATDSRHAAKAALPSHQSESGK